MSLRKRIRQPQATAASAGKPLKSFLRQDKLGRLGDGYSLLGILLCGLSKTLPDTSDPEIIIINRAATKVDIPVNAKTLLTKSAKIAVKPYFHYS